MKEPLLVHVTTTDMNLALLLGPQRSAFAAAGFDVVGVSAPRFFAAEARADDTVRSGAARSTLSAP